MSETRTAEKFCKYHPGTNGNKKDTGNKKSNKNPDGYWNCICHNDSKAIRLLNNFELKINLSSSAGNPDTITLQEHIFLFSRLFNGFLLWYMRGSENRTMTATMIFMLLRPNLCLSIIGGCCPAITRNNKSWIT
ncbi:hypothetical protein [uncultured Methanoregula sp.]|uniref:hypothetical protein n=1 Tax=uncultured Methanoregula sp. TaxID=1005933 RepID=UPI002AAB5F2A|nr:hypothetical protein [uncultured Methanoregula sp.]